MENKYIDIINEINSLDELEKLSIYMKYYISILAMKHGFYTVDRYKKNIELYGVPHETFNNINIYKYDKDAKAISFQEFISSSNIKVFDNGENWKERHYAQRYTVQLNGIYNWYLKNKIIN